MSNDQERRAIKAHMKSLERMVEGLRQGNERLARGDIPTCNFCGKTHAEVPRLLAGANAFICDSCVRLAMDVLSDNTDSGSE